MQKFRYLFICVAPFFVLLCNNRRTTAHRTITTEKKAPTRERKLTGPMIYPLQQHTQWVRVRVDKTLSFICSASSKSVAHPNVRLFQLKYALSSSRNIYLYLCAEYIVVVVVVAFHSSTPNIQFSAEHQVPLVFSILSFFRFVSSYSLWPVLCCFSCFIVWFSHLVRLMIWPLLFSLVFLTRSTKIAATQNTRKTKPLNVTRWISRVCAYYMLISFDLISVSFFVSLSLSRVISIALIMMMGIQSFQMIEMWENIHGVNKLIKSDI